MTDSKLSPMSHNVSQVASILIVPPSRKQSSKWSMSHPEGLWYVVERPTSLIKKKKKKATKLLFNLTFL